MPHGGAFAAPLPQQVPPAAAAAARLLSAKRLHALPPGLLLAVAAGLILSAVRVADRAHLNALINWVDAHRARGAVLLVAIHVLCTGV